MLHICGRKVKVHTRTKSQTVNICSPRNIHGEYDYVVRLRPPFVTEDTLQRQDFRSIEGLVGYLERQHFGEIERKPASTSSHGGELQPGACPPSPIEPAVEPSPKLSETLPLSIWEQNAKLAVENSIDQFILEFIESPYLHRKEHSVHCELFSILTSRRILNQNCPMGGWVTQPVHKEWPEWSPRPGKGNHRGAFDLVVLSPERLKSCSFADFREGRVRPSFVIEVGLDYLLRNHLAPDAAKLKNSGIQNSFLVHLVRQDLTDDFDAVERFVLNSGISTAYARLTSSHAFYKLVNDDKIRVIEIRPHESA